LGNGEPSYICDHLNNQRDHLFRFEQLPRSEVN
jgi:hypothetical protein